MVRVVARQVFLSLVGMFLILYPQSAIAACASCDHDRLCGPRAMLAVCQMFGVDASLEELNTLCGVNEQGSTLAGLYKAAKSKGLEAVGKKIGADELATLRTPAIAHLWKNHFVVVEAENSDKLRLLDPPGEPEIVAITEFQKEYSGFALLIGKDKSLFPESESNGPDLRVSEYSWDLGVVEEGHQFEHTFICRNEGSEGLLISAVDTSCGCTSASLSQNVIRPEGTAELKVTFNTEGRIGAQAQTVYIRSNDQITPVVQLHVSCEVRSSRLLYWPQSINFGDVRPGQNPSVKISIPESESQHVQIQGASSSSRLITTSISKGDDGKNFAVNVQVCAESGSLGELRGIVTILTDHPKEPKISVPFTAIIKGDIDVFPDTLLFGILKKGDGGFKKVSITTTAEPFKIESIDSPYEYLKVRATPRSGGKEYDLVATLLRSAPAGYLKSEVTLHTNNPKQPEIKVPVYAMVK